ncbi:MAG: hypothetical protein GY811_26905 [Myxococcales bacterium]|nr:hypothetical protein [Myxococcales bacterium]
MALASGVGTSACKKDEDAAKAGDGEMIKPAAKGTKYEPAVNKSQVPDGVWICDMGTVHFAAGEKGEGTCDICGMYLVQKRAEKAPAASEKAPEANEKAPEASEKAPEANEKAPVASEKAPEAAHGTPAGHSH